MTQFKTLGKCEECGAGIDIYPDDPGPHLCRVCRARLRSEGKLPERKATLDFQRNQIRRIPIYTFAVPVDNCEWLGLVSGTAVMGANVVRDVAAAIVDVVGGRSNAYQSSIKTGRDHALSEMVDEAVSLGASLVAGVSIDVESINNMFVVFARGTALKRVAANPSDETR